MEKNENKTFQDDIIMFRLANTKVTKKDIMVEKSQ